MTLDEAIADIRASSRHVCEKAHERIDALEVPDGYDRVAFLAPIHARLDEETAGIFERMERQIQTLWPEKNRTGVVH